MGWGEAKTRRRLRGGLFVLAFLALALKIVAPPGYMTADTGAHPFALVICTGHGPITIDPTDTAPAHKSAPDAPCAFAANGVGAAPPDEIALGAAGFAVYRPLVSAAARDLAPGRGLAAPPPPSQGPPRLV
jgi:hypothetical protein